MLFSQEGKVLSVKFDDEVLNSTSGKDWGVSPVTRFKRWESLNSTRKRQDAVVCSIAELTQSDG